jgi:hypothetical protein
LKSVITFVIVAYSLKQGIRTVIYPLLYPNIVLLELLFELVLQT